MFKPNISKTPEEYIGKIDEPRKSDIATLYSLIRKILPKEKPFMMSGMIAFIPYHYKYPSGREGDWFIVGLASQKNYISVYVCAAVDGQYVPEKYKGKFPKANIGRSCIRFKRVSDIDLSVLEKVIREGVGVMEKPGFGF